FALASFGLAVLGTVVFTATAAGFEVVVLAAVLEAGVDLVVAVLEAVAGAICDAGLTAVFVIAGLADGAEGLVVAVLADGADGLAAGFGVVPCDQAETVASTSTEIVFVAFISLPLTSPPAWPARSEQVHHG